MAYISGIDVSQYQGSINWPQVPQQIAIIKASGGDAGLYYDSKCTVNYYGARAAGKAVGLYHFAGGGDPVNEADYFIGACSPLAQDDVLVLDWEIKHANPVGWCLAFVNRVRERTGVWPLIYFNGSTWNTYDWTPVTRNCGVWVAWYDRDPEGTLPVGNKTYVMHQYTSNGSVAGIAGRVDMNAWFGTVEQFKKYGYQVATPAPVPEPTPIPVPEPTPIPQEPIPEPTDPVVVIPVEPIPEPTPVPEPTTHVDTTKDSQIVAALKDVWQAILRLFKRKK